MMLRVLVVEDEPLYAGQLEEILEELGYEVAGPAHSAAALAPVRKARAPPDVALLGIQLGQWGTVALSWPASCWPSGLCPLSFLLPRPIQPLSSAPAP